MKCTVRLSIILCLAPIEQGDCDAVTAVAEPVESIQGLDTEAYSIPQMLSLMWLVAIPEGG